MTNHIQITFVFTFLAPLLGSCQNTLTRIDFTKKGRGFTEQIIITGDSVLVRIEDRRSDATYREYAASIQADEWSQLNHSIKSISFPQIEMLKSPTMKRTYDGALHGKLVFYNETGKTFSHGFDNEKPHLKLKETMKRIQAIRERIILDKRD